MDNNIKIKIKFNSDELKNKEKMILDYQPLYEEVRQIVSDLYVLGSICETLESQGLIEIDEKEKEYFKHFKEYDLAKEIENNTDKFMSSSLYFEELYETCITNHEVLEISFHEEHKIENEYLKSSILKWKI